MGKSRAELKHDGMVKDLESYLFSSMDYDKMVLFFEYCRNGERGEVDLLAMADDITDFYEVKVTYGKKQRKRAQGQYDRFRRAFPEDSMNGFLYCGSKIMRLDG